MITILFPSEPFEPRQVDGAFAHEREAALSAGFDVALFDQVLLAEGDAREALARNRITGSAVYRGWMLTVLQYTALYDSLFERGVELVSSPQRYAFCHELPNNYPALEGDTPRSVWCAVAGEPNIEAILRCAAQLGPGPAVLKDYVKSQKHYWNDACYIPNAADSDHVEAVVRRFLELQGAELNGGLVFRSYVPLQVVGQHPTSGMPLAAEFRSFWFDGKLVLSHKYWGRLTSFDTELPLEWMQRLVSKIDSAFFTMDVALKEDGTWVVIELGDGQVASLPSPDLAPQFFRDLAEAHPGLSSPEPVPHGSVSVSPFTTLRRVWQE